MNKVFSILFLFLISCGNAQESLTAARGPNAPSDNKKKSQKVKEAWDKIKIPNAICGDGSGYYVYYKKLDSTRIVIELMGGGACWDQETCYGKNSMTTLYDRGVSASKQNLTGLISYNNNMKNDSELFFPYCTGDVFAGEHVAQYQVNQVNHQGYSNVVMALKFLSQNKIINFANYKNVVLSGSSAGALGVLMHAKNVEPYLDSNAVKTMILDSPGLHWGPDFWKKFTPELIADFQKNLNPIGIEPSLDNGNMAPYMNEVCNTFSNWQIGILQSTRDMVMSKFFGNISQDEHEKLVLGPSGIIASTLNSQNCYTWVPRSSNHSFLTQVPIDWAHYMNAYDFSYLVINRKAKK